MSVGGIVQAKRMVFSLEMRHSRATKTSVVTGGPGTQPQGVFPENPPHRAYPELAKVTASLRCSPPAAVPNRSSAISYLDRRVQSAQLESDS